MIEICPPRQSKGGKFETFTRQKIKEQHFAHSFGVQTKLKIPFEIKPPFIKRGEKSVEQEGLQQKSTVFSSVFALWPVDFETRSLPINVKNRTTFTYAKRINFFILSCYKKGVKVITGGFSIYVKMLLILLYDNGSNRMESDESSKQ